MAMKELFFLLCTASAASLWLPATAQSRTDPEDLRVEQRLAETIGLERLPSAPSQADARNVSSLLQMGTGNRGDITQNNTGVLANSAFVEQAGLSNQLSFTQTGEGNSARITQDGDRNELNVNLTGDRNEMKLVQDGDDNKINSTVVGDSRKYEVMQIGNNHTLNQLESTPLAPRGYSVEMRGNGIQLTIEQGRVLP